MKLFKSLLFLTFMLSIMAIFLQCAGAKKLETNAPFIIGEVYYQNQDTRAQSGGSGINIVISIVSNPNKVLLDSVYFLGKQTKLKSRNDSVFIGEFKTHSTSKNDIIMSNEPYAEYSNKVPEIPKNSRFQLEVDECVISYKWANKVRYFKIGNINKKEALHN